MATQQDLQELLRLLTVGRKLPMMQAMSHIKALQASNLRSIQQIAEAPPPTVSSAIKDEKQARALQSACKAVLKRGDSGGKRGAPSSATSTTAAKRAKHDDLMTGPMEMTPEELESSLELPLCMEKESIAGTVLQTNRAPLVLAFAVELLRYTMPDQPPSSRLSLAQAVVSANSRSKAVNIGLEKGPSADEEGWGHGQPRLRVMGRDIAVLKRGGYEWKGDETVDAEHVARKAGADDNRDNTETQTQSSSTTATFEPTSVSAWSTSQPISLKKSTFIARAAHITDASQRPALLRSLMNANPDLKTATHNAWACRVSPPTGNASGRVLEDAFDDGETGCGDLMLRIMRETDAVDTMVVLTRWYGGILLGPDRWRLMRNCVTSALSERLRKTGTEVSIGQEAVWGLDLEATKKKSNAAAYDTTTRYQGGTSVVGMQIHRPEAARGYLMKSFASAPSTNLPEEEPTDEQRKNSYKLGNPSGKSPKAPKKTMKALDAEKEENLGLLLGSLRLLFDSWADHLTPTELDRRAWSWYVAVRPDVESGPSGWGAKGLLKLADILKLCRTEQS